MMTLLVIVALPWVVIAAVVGALFSILTGVRND